MHSFTGSSLTLSDPASATPLPPSHTPSLYSSALCCFISLILPAHNSVPHASPGSKRCWLNPFDSVATPCCMCNTLALPCKWLQLQLQLELQLQFPVGVANCRRHEILQSVESSSSSSTAMTFAFFFHSPHENLPAPFGEIEEGRSGGSCLYRVFGFPCHTTRRQ